MNRSRLQSAFRAALLHFVLSALIATGLAILTFGWWYPYPYRALAGGMHLFLIMVIVDVICGPMLTAVVFNPEKQHRELVLDLVVIVLVQLSALVYGVHSVFVARPVVLAYEVDRFVAVPAVMVDTGSLDQAPPNLQVLSWTGPVVVGTRKARNAQEVNDSLTLSLQGLEISARPGWWVPYTRSVPDVKRRMRRLAGLRLQRDAREQHMIDAAVAEVGHGLSSLFYLPLTSRDVTDWIVLLDAEAQIVGFAHVDGFLE